MGRARWSPRSGVVRRELFVPRPSVWSLENFNAGLPDRCLELATEPHCRKDTEERGLFSEDRAALPPLPGKRFDVVAWRHMKADRYGVATLGGRHRYSAVYGQINVYGVTTKSERHKRSYWTRTADGNGIGGRKAPVPYGFRWIPGCQQPTHGPREERNDDTGACPTEYQAARDERPDAYADS